MVKVKEQKNGNGQLQFGLIVVDLNSGKLRRSGNRVHLQSQPFKVLAALLEHSGEVVTRESLQQRLRARIRPSTSIAA